MRVDGRSTSDELITREGGWGRMAGMRAMWCVLIWLTGCLVEPATRTAPPVVEPATRTAPPVVDRGAPSPLVERLAVLPARFGAVGWFSIDRAPLVGWVQGVPGAPACIAEIKAGLEGYLQASDLAAAQSVIVFRGAVDRARVEACVRALVEHVGVPVDVTQSGRITAVTSKGRALTHLGWSDDGIVVWNDERAVVEEVLDRKTSLRADAALVSLLARVEPGASGVDRVRPRRHQLLDRRPLARLRLRRRPRGVRSSR